MSYQLLCNKLSWNIAVWSNLYHLIVSVCQESKSGLVAFGSGPSWAYHQAVSQVFSHLKVSLGLKDPHSVSLTWLLADLIHHKLLDRDSSSSPHGTLRKVAHIMSAYFPRNNDPGGRESIRNFWYVHFFNLFTDLFH